MSRLPRKTVGEMFTVILPIYIGNYSTSQVPDNKFMIILLVILINEKTNIIILDLNYYSDCTMSSDNLIRVCRVIFLINS